MKYNINSGVGTKGGWHLLGSIFFLEHLLFIENVLK